jgi:toxin ParE1/3/4
MSRLLFIEPEAETEIDEIAEWYHRQNPAARIGFLQALDRALDFMRSNPEQYQTVYQQFRRARLDGFPYGIFYRLTDQQITVVACFHSSRGPDIWRDRLR